MNADSRPTNTVVCEVELVSLREAATEFVRMQHDIARLLGVDADTDSIDLHQRIYDSVGSHVKRAVAESLSTDDNETFSAWRRYGLNDAWLARTLRRLSPEPAAKACADQAPIVRVTVVPQGVGYVIEDAVMYAPGLPPGDHDLYCVPFPADMAPLPHLEEIQLLCEDAMHSHGDYEGSIRSIYGITQRAQPVTKSAHDNNADVSEQSAVSNAPNGGAGK